MKTRVRFSELAFSFWHKTCFVLPSSCFSRKHPRNEWAR